MFSRNFIKIGAPEPKLRLLYIQQLVHEGRNFNFYQNLYFFGQKTKFEKLKITIFKEKSSTFIKKKFQNSSLTN